MVVVDSHSSHAVHDSSNLLHFVCSIKYEEGTFPINIFVKGVWSKGGACVDVNTHGLIPLLNNQFGKSQIRLGWSML